MHYQPRRTATVTLVAVIVVVLAIGCASTGRKRTGKTESVISNMETRMQLAIDQVDSIVVSLSALQGLRGDLLTNQYRVFTKEVAAIEKMAASLRSRSDAMKKQGEAYFAAWEEGVESISDEEIRQMSEARKAELRRKYGEISEEMQQTRAVYDSFIENLRNIQKALDLDLSPTAVQMLNNRIAQAEESGETLKDELRDVARELDELVRKMSTGR